MFGKLEEKIKQVSCKQYDIDNIDSTTFPQAIKDSIKAYETILYKDLGIGKEEVQDVQNLLDLWFNIEHIKPTVKPMFSNQLGYTSEIPACIVKTMKDEIEALLNGYALRTSTSSAD